MSKKYTILPEGVFNDIQWHFKNEEFAALPVEEQRRMIEEAGRDMLAGIKEGIKEGIKKDYIPPMAGEVEATRELTSIEKMQIFCWATQDFFDDDPCIYCPKQIRKRCHKGHNGFLDWLENRTNNDVDDELYTALKECGLLGEIE